MPHRCQRLKTVVAWAFIGMPGGPLSESAHASQIVFLHRCGNSSSCVGRSVRLHSGRVGPKAPNATLQAVLWVAKGSRGSSAWVCRRTRLCPSKGNAGATTVLNGPECDLWRRLASCCKSAASRRTVPRRAASSTRRTGVLAGSRGTPFGGCPGAQNRRAASCLRWVCAHGGAPIGAVRRKRCLWARRPTAGEHSRSTSGRLRLVESADALPS